VKAEARAQLMAFGSQEKTGFAVATKAGGEVRGSVRTLVRVPAGATDGGAVTVKVDEADSDGERGRKADRRGLKPAGPAVRFGPPGKRFTVPVTLELEFDPAEIPAGKTAQDLRVHYWNPSSEEWEALSSTVDQDAGVVRALTTHFSLYQVLTGGGPAVADPSDPWGLGEVFVYPNPAVGGTAPRFHVETGTADRVTIAVFDISGREVHRVVLHGDPGVTGVGSGPAYESAWEGRIASGVYLFTATAERSGKAPLRTSGRFAVVR